MALDQTDICNLALTRIGWKTLISSIDDDGTEAAMCKLYYAHCLQKALSKADWNFARKRADLVEEAGDPPDEWGYQYLWPADCLAPRRFVDGMQEQRQGSIIKFTIEWSADTSKKLIYSDIEPDDATLIYTYDVTDEAKLDPMFADYLAWYLAFEIALPLANNVKRRTDAGGGMKLAFQEAVRFNVVTEPMQWLGMQAGVYRDGPTIESRE
jgi:hypothetical protein